MRRTLHERAKRLSIALTLVALALTLTAYAESAFGEERTYQVGCNSVVRPCERLKALPLQIREVRNLQNEHWMRDLEIEVKNVSNKPIYGIVLYLALPDTGSESYHYGIPLSYGEGLLRIGSLAKPDDVALKPGETYVFTISEGLWKGFDNYVARVGLPDYATRRVVFIFDSINFGDGTGYNGAARFMTRNEPLPR